MALPEVVVHSPARAVEAAAPRKRPGSRTPNALGGTVLWGALSTACLTPAFGMPVSVTLSPGDGGALQLSVGGSAGTEPILHWGGATGPGPYRLMLAWSGRGVTLDGALPSLPPEGRGPLRSVFLHDTAEESQLELQLAQPVQPYMRRVGNAWVLRLDPVSQVPDSVASASQVAAPAPQPRRAVPSGARDRKAGADSAAAEVLLLDVIVNGERQKEIARAEQTRAGQLLLAAPAWQEARLSPLAQAGTLSDGSPAYLLDAVAGASYHINRQSLTLDINAPATAFVGSTLDPQGNVVVPPSRPQPGVMLNYDVSATHAQGATTAGALVEAVAFSGVGNFVTSALVSHSDTATGNGVSRLDSYWRYDLPNRMQTLVVGDTVGVGGGWSRPVRYAGIRWGRDFGMRPGFVTLPQIALAGEAALPSTVEVLVNNARRLSQPVPPGPFDLSSVPVVTGAGEIGLVVRDLLGRETVAMQSYYASPRLLAPGLSDFSFEAGRLRTGYGRDSSYGEAFGSATWRQGLTNSLTGEGRFEVQRDRRAAGMELSGLLGSWAVWRAAAAAAAGSTEGIEAKGTTLQVGVERSTAQSGGGAVQYEHSSRGFAPFGEGPGLLIRSQRARDRWLFSLGGPLWGAASAGASFVRQTRWDGDLVQLLGLSLSAPLWQRASLNVSIDKRLDHERGWSGSVAINLPLENGIHAAARVERDATGRLAGVFSAAQTAPAGPGVGWRVEAATIESQRLQGGVQYNTNHAEFALDAVAGARGQVATRAGARGTVGWVDGMPFASRPVGEGSVAVIKVEGLEGVPVSRANQVVATTDASGRAFVPGLLPWQNNLIAVDPSDLPMDVQVAATQRDVTPYARTAVVVDFAVKRSRQALLVLHQRGGAPVPIGTQVRLLPGGAEFVAGRRGEVWLTDLESSRQQVQVTWPTGGCTLELAVPAAVDGTPGRIGPLDCGG
jgi:outer membrane usher protein